MKALLIILIFVVSLPGFCVDKTLTKAFNVTRLKYNEIQKNYDVDFSERAGIYNADSSLVKCLQESIEKKKAVRVKYEIEGLKIIKCDPN